MKNFSSVRSRPTRRDAYNFFRKGTMTLARMEANGIAVDTKYLKKTIDDTGNKIKEMDRQLRDSDVWKKWKRRFRDPNIESTPQLATILFDVLGYKPQAWTEKTMDLEESKRTPKMDEYALRHVDHPFVKDYFKVKKLRKVLGTYLKGIDREVYKGLLHPSYNLAGGLEDEQKGGAASYRSSCSNPNFMNIPIRNKAMGGLIRPCFCARTGRYLVEGDFSGVEVRIAYCYHLDPTMHKYLTDPKSDMHADQACVLFCLTRDQVVKGTTRDSAKNQWVFPQFYGSTWFQCAPVIWEAMELRNFKVGENGISIREHLRKKGITKLGSCDPDSEPEKGTFARHLIDAEKKLWNERFPVYTQWKRSFYNQYLERGYFDLYTGFRCAGFFRRNQVINFPVQGAAFHCLLWTLIRMQEEIDARGMKSLLVGQIHDSCLGDVPKNEINQYLDLFYEISTVELPKAWDWITIGMETEVDVSPIGKSWHDKQPWHKTAKHEWSLKI